MRWLTDPFAFLRRDRVAAVVHLPRERDGRTAGLIAQGVSTPLRIPPRWPVSVIIISASNVTAK